MTAPHELDRTIMPSLAEERLVRDALPIVQEVARRVQRELGQRLSVDDLVSIGNMALIDLVRRYDAALAPLAAYLRPRLRWAILDVLRGEAHDVEIEARVRALVASDLLLEEHARERPPEPALLGEEEHQKRLRDLVFEHAAAMGIALLAGDGRVVAKNDSSEDPEKNALRAALSQRLKEVVATLEEKRREVVERHYYRGERFDEIAAALGVSKSRVSRLHLQALQQLAELLAAGDPR